MSAATDALTIRPSRIGTDQDDIYIPFRLFFLSLSLSPRFFFFFYGLSLYIFFDPRNGLV